MERQLGAAAMTDAVEVRIDVECAMSDAEEVDELTRGLRSQLLELDVADVSPVRVGPPPVGSKGADVAAIGALLVQLATSSGLATVVSAIRSWLGSGGPRTVKLSVGGDSLEVTGATSRQQQQLIDDWLSRHAGG
jgi:hypothetical protein